MKALQHLSAATLIILVAATPTLQAASSGENSTRRGSAKEQATSKQRQDDDNRNTQSQSLENTPINVASFNERELSRMVFELTNRERVKAGLPPLRQNRALAASALAHSQDMASRAYFGHKSKGFFNRTDPGDRASAAGYNTAMVAENIAMVPTYNRQTIQPSAGFGRAQVIDTDWNTYGRLAEIATREWMNSPGHRANILNRRLNCLGVGVAVGTKNNVPYVYLTQNFGG